MVRDQTSGSTGLTALSVAGFAAILHSRSHSSTTPLPAPPPPTLRPTLERSPINVRIANDLVTPEIRVTNNGDPLTHAVSINDYTEENSNVVLRIFRITITLEGTDSQLPEITVRLGMNVNMNFALSALTPVDDGLSSDGDTVHYGEYEDETESDVDSEYTDRSDSSSLAGSTTYFDDVD